MSDTRDKRAEEIQAAIRGVLFYDWDPVNVRGNEKLKDEYDRYIAQIYRVLTSTPTREAIAHELVTIEWECMGLGQTKEAALFPVADKLLSIDVRLDR